VKIVGTTLMAFGTFFISVGLAALLGPWLRSLGIDVRAETTSVIGTSLIGAFSFATGMLLRRRATESELGRQSIAEAESPAQLGEGAATFVRRKNDLSFLRTKREQK
jgi:hypothetical protein